MASITTQIADQVVTLINEARPYAGEVRAERLPVVHVGREDIEDILVSVIAGVRTSERFSRNSWSREYPVQIVIDRAVDTTRNAQVDVLHEVVEGISEALEPQGITVGTRNFGLTRVETDPDTSGLTDSQHLVVALTAVYLEIHAT